MAADAPAARAVMTFKKDDDFRVMGAKSTGAQDQRQRTPSYVSWSSTEGTRKSAAQHGNAARREKSRMTLL